MTQRHSINQYINKTAIEKSYNGKRRAKVLNQIIHLNNSTTAFLALGSNLGNPQQNLDSALELLGQHESIELINQSSYHANPAIEGAGPEEFLNAVIKINTTLSAYELLELVLSIELIIDPERNSRGRKTARKLDIDILTYGELKLNETKLTLPHPRMQERDFVMKPLAELQS